MDSNPLRKLRSKLIAPLGLPPPSSSANRRPIGRKRDYHPIHWSQYFTSCEKVVINEDGDTFNVYQRGLTGPLLVLLHGGGFSALTWSLFTECIETMVSCRVLAIDLRGHGDSKTQHEDNLSAETQADDVVAVIKQIFGSEVPPIILVGHSMGGAIAVHTAASEHVRSGQIRNAESARVSMPGQLSSETTGECAISEVSSSASITEATSPTGSATTSPLAHGECIKEEDELEKAESPSADNSIHLPPPAPVNNPGFRWRIDLTKTEHHWPGWFHGLSNTFLSISVPKLLLLAGIDRLDKELTVGQMQGKFQMQVLPQCGHAVHEDVPDKVAEVVATFLVRNRLTSATEKFEWVMPAC
nr:EOG090X07NZ [Chydorus sphaericus]